MSARWSANPKTYEHIDPTAVGNSRRIVVSDQGRAQQPAGQGP